MKRNERKGTPVTTERDPAMSMSLLTGLLANPLDAGYGYYPKSGSSSRSAWWQKVIVVVLACALGVASVVAVRALRHHARDDGTRADLVKQVEARQDVVSSLNSDVQSLTSQVHASSIPTDISDSTDPSAELINALTPVEGPGLKITLKDSASADATRTNGTMAGTVRDQDLNVIVNALWSSGAEAVAINGIRLGPGTFIRTAGSVILINVTPVQSPYTIEAIGDANVMSVALVKGATGDYLSSAQSLNGISLSTAGAPSLSLPALDARKTRYATIVEGN
ncbi:DUF881 domain-containing protein [Schaalia sp. ZJ1691]|uniref:DUF881 domain-containing protein n=1 Tax=Schaalia sp. ZJ1691 TaxID=2709404 RepID=UPI001F15709E|nr:DUF881 domain-containing protein [Schaalia sp. ZJ1691]